MAEGRVRGKVAVVTGAGGGLGTAIALGLASEGAAVVCQDVVDDAARRTAASIVDQGGRGMHWTCDVADSAAIRAMFDEAAASFGVIDVAVANAGVNRTEGDGAEAGTVSTDELGQFQIMTPSSWRRMIEVHLDGAFNCAQQMVRRLIEADKPGSLICISSVSALIGLGPLHYCAAKGGLHGLVKGLAVSGGPRGIRANIVAPGIIRTPMEASIDHSVHEALLERVPLRRRGEPADIANAVLFLASDESDYLTGQVLSPSGGLAIL